MSANSIMSETKETPQPTQAKKPTVKLCNFEMKTDKFGSTITVENCSPAEMLLLCAEHGENAGGDPVVSITKEWEVEATDEQVLGTLYGRYRATKVNALFPGTSPVLPKTFEEARSKGVGRRLPHERLIEHKLA